MTNYINEVEIAKTVSRTCNGRSNKVTLIDDYLELLAFLSVAAAIAADLAADLARAVGFKALLGFSAFLILKTAHAVPKACPAASSPSLVAAPASSPYLQKTSSLLIQI